MMLQMVGLYVVGFVFVSFTVTAYHVASDSSRPHTGAVLVMSAMWPATVVIMGMVTIGFILHSFVDTLIDISEFIVNKIRGK